MREKYIKEYKEKGYIIIGVFMNLGLDILKNRIEKSKKETSCLRVSNNFNEVLERQASIFKEPKSNEFDYYFEIKNENDLKTIQNNIINITKNNL